MAKRPSIGERILFWCRLRRMTQAELAARLGRHPSDVSRWVRKKNPRIPSATDIEAIASVFDLSEAQFYGDIGAIETAMGVKAS